MSNVKEPVLTEKTGIRIAEAIELSNAIARDNASHMAQQTSFMKEISSRIGGDDIYFVTATYADESYTLVSDVQEAVNAYAAGKQLVLLIHYGENAYGATPTRVVENSDGTVKAFQFGASSLRPVGNAGLFTLMVASSAFSSSSAESAPAGTKDICLYLGSSDYYDIESKLKFAMAVLGSARAASILVELS